MIGDLPVPTDYPFAAVVGQERLKLALLLVAVDPSVGGLLIVGEKGSAKSTLARGLADLLGDSSPFIELPVGATEDRVVGSLDLGAAMAENKEKFKAGMMIQADGGILYIDEVNLLQDHIVDLLLDASASGVVRVERDGFSASTRSRFILCGSMNPEEGELRPQLLDRFGMSVNVPALDEVEMRAEAVARRIHFDDDPHDFLMSYSSQTEEVRQRIRDAREIVASGRLDRDELLRLSRLAAQISLSNGVEGIRGDLVMVRAARAYAALQGRHVVEEDDLIAVSGFALAHRAGRKPSSGGTTNEPDISQSGTPSSTSGAVENPMEGDQDESGSAGDGSEVIPSTNRNHDSGGDHEVPGDGASRTSEDGQLADGRQERDSSGSAEDRPSSAHGEAGFSLAGLVPKAAASTGSTLEYRRTKSGVGSTETRLASAPIAVRDSFIASIMTSATTESDGPSGLTQILFKRLLISDERCVLFIIDCSGSMDSTLKIETARTAIEHLLGDSYVKRHSVAIVSFSGTQAEISLMPTRSIEVARVRLEQLKRGGKTPLQLGLLKAMELSKRLRSKAIEPFLVLLSDGMASWAPSGLDPIEAALQAADEVAKSKIDGIVLDFEESDLSSGGAELRIGLCADMATRAGLGYLRLERQGQT